MKQTIAFLLFWVGLTACQPEEYNIYTEHVKEVSKDKDGWKLVWSEEFEQDSRIPNPDTWTLVKKEVSPWNRYMSESYDQAYVEDGKLFVKAEKKDGEYKTGGVWTMNKKGFKYGKLEICAKFTSIQGGWAAIWMMPQERQYPLINNNYPGEIDIMEQVSLEKVAQHSVHTHYTLDLGNDKNPPRNGYGNYVDGEFNLYGIEWTKDKIIYTVNGEETFSYPNLHLSNEPEMQQWPFDVPYYLILNYSVGGENTWPGIIDDKGLPAHMEVEYVRYYEKESKGDSDVDEEEFPDELIKNGSFEDTFAPGKQPGVYMAGDTDWNKILGHIDQWFSRWDAPQCQLSVDNSIGANNTYSSLKYSAQEVTLVYQVNLSYASQSIKPGKYELSYYVKTNQDNTPFTLSVLLCETAEEIGWALTGQKVIIFRNGQQEITTQPSWDVAATTETWVGKEWKKCTVTLDIPENVLVRFIIKPCAYMGNGDPCDIWGKGAWDGVTYWFDEFNLTPIE